MQASFNILHAAVLKVLLQAALADMQSHFTGRYALGKVIGAGSFGIVRECTEKSTRRKFACKTIPKMPKRGKGTPR